MSVLKVIIASTRPGRVGLPVGTWFAPHERAERMPAADAIPD